MATSSDDMLPPATDFDDSPVWINDPEFQGHRPCRWGFAIVRTAYGPGSDEQSRRAINIVNRVAQV
ncbi:hypothetical protein EDB82DRAFT_522421 [Fusarium venenatum]|uniref:uncharacterized protein n=1 Tax=Fusarium venenatum TaxID=56646 RepID=UPI001DA77A6E|nr:hypothetical protein EDB82DRAFT_522421 [Fusarium venenatum]